MQNPRMQTHVKKCAVRTFGMVLHSWFLESAPPVIYLHIWGVLFACFCILVVWQSATACLGRCRYLLSLKQPLAWTRN